MIKSILFVISFLAILFGGHLILYFSVIKLFHISNLNVKGLLFFSLICLSLSFIIGMILVHWQENFITKGIYWLAALWMSIYINLLMASLLVWVVILSANIMNVKLSQTIIYGLFIIISFLYSINGIINAFNPKITSIDVMINNLPSAWENKKIVQLSDIHLGIIYNAKYLNKLVDQVNNIDADIILITGDLVDGTDGDLSSFIEPINNLKAKQGIYFAHGNHEVYVGKDETINFLEQTNIQILDNKSIDIDGLQIAGISYDNNSEIENLEINKPSILMHHTPTAIKSVAYSVPRSEDYVKPDVNFDKAKELGIDLQLSGHTHAGQIFPFNYIAKWIFQGYDYGLNRQDDFQIYTSSGVGTWGPPMRTGTKSEIVVITLEL